MSFFYTCRYPKKNWLRVRRMVAEKKILYRHVEVNGSNKKMHQLQFKHLKE